MGQPAKQTPYHRPESPGLQSWVLHFWVSSGHCLWSHRLRSSSTSPVLVFMHFTCLLWMPPPQVAVHCREQPTLSRAPGEEALSPKQQPRPSSPENRFLGRSQEADTPLSCSPAPKIPPSIWCRDGRCRVLCCSAGAGRHTFPPLGRSPGALALLLRTIPSTGQGRCSSWESIKAPIWQLGSLGTPSLHPQPAHLSPGRHVPVKARLHLAGYLRRWLVLDSLAVEGAERPLVSGIDTLDVPNLHSSSTGAQALSDRQSKGGR